MKDKLERIILGISYQRSFRIPEISGSMIDFILTSSKSPFDTAFFPKVESNNWEKMIHNPDNGDFLKLTQDDLVISIKVDNDFEVKYEWLSTNVLNFIMNFLFRKFSVKNIKRVGIVFEHGLPVSRELNSAIGFITDGVVSEPNKVDIAFSQKKTANRALNRDGIDDFLNSIYVLQSSDERFLAHFDFQYYYKPFREDIGDCFVDEVMKAAKDSLLSEYYSWIQKYGPKKN